MKGCGDNCEHPCKDQRADEDLEKRWPELLGSVKKPQDEGDARTNKRKHNAQWLSADYCYSRENVLGKVRYNCGDEKGDEIRGSTARQD